MYHYVTMCHEQLRRVWGLCFRPEQGRHDPATVATTSDVLGPFAPSVGDLTPAFRHCIAVLQSAAIEAQGCLV
jgi:hypothetical protein